MMPKKSQYVVSTDKGVQRAIKECVRRDYRVAGSRACQLRVGGEEGTWVAVYKSPRTGKWAKAAIGKYPSLGLAAAKELAEDVAASARRGVDPIHDRHSVNRDDTFRQLCERYMREHEKRNARAEVKAASTIESQRILDRNILPTLGTIRVASVTRSDVSRVVEAVADRGAYVAADQTLALVRAVFRWAVGTGRAENDPTVGLKKRNAAKPRKRVLTAEEIGLFWHAPTIIEALTPPLRDAMRLQLLTGVRRNEVVETPRSELDLDGALWTLPRHRTKADREHKLPLSPLAVSIFRAAMARADDEGRRRARRESREFLPSKWVFPSPVTPGPIDGHAATRAILRSREELAALGIAPFNTHDLRRTISTHMGEMEVPDEIIERILNHAPRTVAGKHYNHARYLQPMRAALNAWADNVAVMIGKSQTEVSYVCPERTRLSPADSLSDLRK